MANINICTPWCWQRGFWHLVQSSIRTWFLVLNAIETICLPDIITFLSQKELYCNSTPTEHTELAMSRTLQFLCNCTVFTGSYSANAQAWDTCDTSASCSASLMRICSIRSSSSSPPAVGYIGISCVYGETKKFRVISKKTLVGSAPTLWIKMHFWAESLPPFV